LEGEAQNVRSLGLAAVHPLLDCPRLADPADDRDRIRQWSHDLALVFDGLRERETVFRAFEAFDAYLSDIIAARRLQPGDDLLSHLIGAENQGDRLTRAEMIAMCVLLLVAGHETTTNLIGNGVLALLRHPAVAQVAVIGLPHDVHGEEVCAVIVRAHGAGNVAEAVAITRANRRYARELLQRWWDARSLSAPAP